MNGLLSIFGGPGLLWIALMVLFGAAWILWLRKWYITSILCGLGAALAFLVLVEAYIV